MSTLLGLAPPQGPCDATVSVPGSKSIANRALVCAMLARSASTVSNLPDGDDTTALTAVLEGAGVLGRVSPQSVTVAPGALGTISDRIDARLAGTTSRFLTAVCSLAGREVVIDGGAPLRARPMGPLHDALRSLGARVEPLGEQGRLPVSVGGRSIVGERVLVDADVSSQFVSSLLLIAPCLPRGLRLDWSDEPVSRTYIDMTLSVMSIFGAEFEADPHGVQVAPTGYSGTEFVVEPDFSSAAFPVCAVLIRGGTVRIPGLPERSIQGDSRLLDLAREMGGHVRFEHGGVVVSRDPGMRPRAIRCDLRHESDLLPALATVCSISGGRSALTGVGFIRSKESDRLAVMTAELGRLGAEVTCTDDGLDIVGVEKLSPSIVDTHDDHRVAMALSLAALSAGAVTLRDPGVVSKSWPTFYSDMAPVLGVATVQE